jgi:hypothetical protein
MELFVMIAAISLPVAIVIYSIIFRYTTLRSVRVVTFLIGVVLSVPLIGFSLYVLLTNRYDSTTSMLAVGICGILLGFWLKKPFSDLD